MAERQTKAKAKSTDSVVESDSTESASTTAPPEVDDLLDEIDSVLEENAAEFVKSYVQKGGQ